MNNKILAIYDISGIQSYIYKTNRLKHIIGGSNLVENIFSKSAQAILDENRGNVVFTGGGNAVFSFPDIGAYKSFNRVFSRKLLLEVPGLAFVTECIERTNCLSKDIGELFQKVAKAKTIANVPCYFNTLPPMMQSDVDKEQVSFIILGEEKEYYSFSTYQKFENANLADGEKYFDEIASPFRDDLQNMMAVIHIDGNNMGKILTNLYSNIQNTNQIKEISQKIDRAFKTALESMKEKLESIEKSNSDFDKIHYRKIYQNGDDVTFICHSGYAITAVCSFFKELLNLKKDELIQLSASAGIAFVKPHYPFNKAYEIAEKRCKAAKEKAKDKAKKELDIGFWLDYEVVRGTNQSDDMCQFEMRPYYVCGKDDKDLRNDSIGILSALLKEFTEGTTDFSNSKLKNLRSAFLFNNLEYASNIMKSTKQEIEGGYKLFEGKDSEDEDFCLDEYGNLDSCSKNPLYDVLDIIDIHRFQINNPEIGGE